MSLEPGYGETPLDGDELDALQPSLREALGGSPSKADIFAIEQAIQQEVSTQLLLKVVEGALSVGDLLTDDFVRQLHSQLYNSIWVWAGSMRQRDLTIGVAGHKVIVELRDSFDGVRYRWEHTNDWNARQLGIATHAELVRVHPFTDGNGRSSRLLAELVFIAAQTGSLIETYDWELDKTTYIALLRQYDANRDPIPLAEFINVIPLE